MKRHLSTLGLILLLAVVYYGTGRFGLSLAFSNKSISAVWPPTGIALVAVLLLGFRVLPGVLIGAFFVNLVINHSPSVSAGIALGNTLETLAGGLLVQSYAGGRNAFAETRTILKFFLFAAVISTLLAATIGPAALCLGGIDQWRQYPMNWFTWWLGDGVSNFVLAPLLLIWTARPHLKWDVAHLPELIILSLTMLIIGGVVFSGWSASQNYPIEYVAVLPLLWAGWRFGTRGASAATVVTSAIAIAGTLHGFGPFGSRDHNEALLLLQAFMATIAVTAIVLAAVVAERMKMEVDLQDARRMLESHARQLEDKVGERTARLQEVVSDLEAFSYTVSHDLRAPLRAMRQYSEVLLEEHADKIDQRAGEILHRIADAGARLDALITDVLTYSRLVQTRVELKVVDLEKLAREIIRGYPHLHHFEGAICIESPMLPVLGSEVFLTQCLANLLGNAVKFVQPGAAPKVRVRTEPRGGTVLLWVEDNGIGIDPQYHSRIFGIFERLHTESEYAGTGMGLAIVRRAVERMGGRVGFKSRPGEGTKFWMELRAPA